jgi:HD-GYP domain-containing protein (c-di-GMP phosphodiesterase class II)
MPDLMLFDLLAGGLWISFTLLLALLRMATASHESRRSAAKPPARAQDAAPDPGDSRPRVEVSWFQGEPASVSTASARLDATGHEVDVLHRVMEQSCGVLDMDRSSLISSEDARPIRVAPCCQADPPPGVIELERDIAQAIFQVRHPVLVPSQREHEGRTGESPAGMGVPVTCGVSRPVAALVLTGGKSARTISSSEVRLLSDIADLVGAAHDHRSWGLPMPAAVATTVEELIGTARDLDEDLDDHAETVQELTLAVGRRLGLRGPAIVELDLAARLHDIGKLELPPELWVKTEPLSEWEWRLVRRHAALGSDMLARFRGLEAVAGLVRFHHERWDGRGYPYGLPGPRIPPASRIIAVCDVYAAMTASRPYQDALTRGGAGERWHPVRSGHRGSPSDGARDAAGAGSNYLLSRTRFARRPGDPSAGAFDRQHGPRDRPIGACPTCRFDDRMIRGRVTDDRPLSKREVTHSKTACKHVFL